MTCTVFESGVIETQVDNVWEKIKPFKFEFWKNVEKVQIEEKNVEHGEVGVVHTIIYSDGTREKVKLQEMSDRQFLLSYEVLETSSDDIPPEIKVSHRLQLREITYNNQSIIEFATKYSDEISLTKFIKSKQSKRNFFDALRRVCTDPDDSDLRPWECHICTFRNIPRGRYPHWRCSTCNKLHMFTKLFRIPFTTDKQRWESETFTMCGQDWRILVLPKGHVEQPGHIAVYLKCEGTYENNMSWECHFILSSLHPDEARVKNAERKFPVSKHDDYFNFKSGEDRGFKEQVTPEVCKQMLDSKGNWGLLLQIIPGERVTDVEKWIDNHIPKMS